MKLVDDDGAARAKRLTEGLQGLLKEELKESGGAEGFVRWVRSDEDAAREESSVSRC